MNHLNRIYTFAAATLALSASGFAFGQTSASDTFDVTATVEAVCTITAGNVLAFGNYDPVAATAVAGTTTIGVTCSNGMSGTEVGLVTDGIMDEDGAGTATLNYGLFQDAEHATAWGDTEATNRQAVGADGTTKTMTVYGQIAADQTTAVTGTYTDTVTATVYW